MRTDVTTWYLEMTDPGQLRPAAAVPELAIRRVEIPSPELNRFLYTAVGGDLFWIDRLPWSFPDWMAYLDRPQLETWVGYIRGTPAGYFELETDGGDVQLVYFGMLPRFVGRGIGGALLTAAVRRAWELGDRRVWLHTCSLDAEAALPSYLARGFRVVRQEVGSKELPDAPLGPWPGANRAGAP